ncbi:putative transglycosylase [Aeromonas phage ZPAH7B]|uniref:Putative transglycosylase n=2 Tax=Aerosvirus ZPAH7 TaxID=2733366 RepID=A0A3S9QHW9_9CAUD|nr:internal virion protein with endolysin domain [Aeromonas phage ZPAH7]AZQ96389.1 putative transglycosylase [Aeromonas phage ZPAH7]QAX95969.1 putative transglycosylase [Aeromonas phage ZPAH7B]
MKQPFMVDNQKATEYDALLQDAETRHGLPTGLLKTTMMIENRNNPANRVSPKGAQGVMQIMPSNFESLGITDPSDPAQSIEGAAKLYSQLNKQYNGDVGAMMAHYNGGNKAGSAYLEGKKLNPETADYIEYASPYLTAMGNPSKYGRAVMGAADTQMGREVLPSDIVEAGADWMPELITGLDAATEARLRQEADLANLTFADSFHMGLKDTVTAMIADAGSREFDPQFRVGAGEQQYVEQQIPGGLNKAESERVYNSRSSRDLDRNIGRINENREHQAKMREQDGVGTAVAIAGQLTGGLMDPIGLPIGSFGMAGRAIKGAGAIANVGRGAVEGAAAMAIISPMAQTIERGDWNAEEVGMNIAAGAVFGAGMGVLARAAGFGGTQDAAINARLNGDIRPEPAAAPGKVNFRDATETSLADDGSTIGIGETEFIKQAMAYDETNALGAAGARRDAYYGSKIRQKMFGWADSSGVILARSDSKVVRHFGRLVAGNQAGIGKAEASTVATQKEILRGTWQHTYIPLLKDSFAEWAPAPELLKHMAGGAKAAEQEFSRLVQIERFKHRTYRKEHGSSDGYTSDAPGPIQTAAKVMDEHYAATKEAQILHETEHSSRLAEEDSVGYIPQTTDWAKIQDAPPAKRAAWRQMVEDEYRKEVTSKLSKMRQDKAEWIEKAYARAEQNIDSPWVDKFLKDPDAYFERNLSELSKKMNKEMSRRANHWWDNAMKDANTKYQNSEASLLQLANELAEEVLTNRFADEDLIKVFQTNLKGKWSDTSRRELDMLASRDVGGEQVLMLDMFRHNVFDNMQSNINQTAGRVAFAKSGWKTEQDIQDTLNALRRSGSVEELEHASFVTDLILGRANKLAADDAMSQAVSNLTYATTMGKMPLAVLADFPVLVGTLGVGGMSKALGSMAKHVISGDLFRKGHKITAVGKELDAYMKGLQGRDHELWTNSAMDGNGMAMEVGGMALRTSQAASRLTSMASGANMVSRLTGYGVTSAVQGKLHSFLKTGKGFTESRLAEQGLNQDIMARIKKQFDEHGSDTEFGLANWTDATAKDDFIAAAYNLAHSSSMDRVKAGEQTKWEQTNLLGFLFGKFRTIGIRSAERVAVRNLTQLDANTAAALTTGLAFATFLAYARVHMDAATSQDPDKVLEERLNPLAMTGQVARMSSMMGLVSEGTSLLDLMTGGGFTGGSDTPLTGTVTRMSDAVGGVGQALTGNGEWSKAFQKSFKALPAGNTYLMLGAAKAMED